MNGEQYFGHTFHGSQIKWQGPLFQALSLLLIVWVKLWIQNNLDWPHLELFYKKCIYLNKFRWKNIILHVKHIPRLSAHKTPTTPVEVILLKKFMGIQLQIWYF